MIVIFSSSLSELCTEVGISKLSLLRSLCKKMGSLMCMCVGVGR